MYNAAGISHNLTVYDLITMMSIAEQLARCLSVLNQMDVELMKKREIDHRKLQISHLQTSSNLVLTSFLKAHSSSEKLQPDSYLISSLLQRQVNAQFIPPFIRSLSEFAAKSHDTHDLIDVLSHLNVSESRPTIDKQLQNATEKYKKPYSNYKPIMTCIDNIDIPMTKHLHDIDFEDC